MIRLVSMNPVFPCPCCGYLTFSEKPGSYEICPICFWEDDQVQVRWPTLARGANKLSLAEAQKTFAAIGACEERLPGHASAWSRRRTRTRVASGH
jgi:hypothetical protein